MHSKVYALFTKAAIAILLVLSLWLVIGAAYKKEIGNLSDWISAGCNVVMAAAATYAAIAAKKWMQQRSHTVGFDKAEQLLIRIDAEYVLANKNRMHLIYMQGYLNAIEEGYDSAKRDRGEEYAELSNQLLELNNNIHLLYHDLDLLERWNLIVNKKDIIKKLLTLLADYNTKLSITAKCAELCINCKIDEENEYTKQKELYEKHSSIFCECSISLDEVYNQFHKLKFTDLFHVK